MKVELIQGNMVKPAILHPTDLKVGQALRYDSGNIIVKIANDTFLKYYAPSFVDFEVRGKLDLRVSDKGTLIPGEVVVTVKVGQ